MKNKLNKWLFLPLLSIGLVACGGSSKVITDNSADYKSARAFSGLKKNTFGDAQQSDVMAEQQDSPPFYIGQPVTDNKTVSTTGKQQLFAITLVKAPGEIKRLHIESGFEQAWAFIGNKLKSEGFTIHNRNKGAGRYAIGCGDIQDDDTVIKKSGKWSLFKSKVERSEHCTVLIISEGSNSTVSVLDRNSLEVVGVFSQPVLQRLLN